MATEDRNTHDLVLKSLKSTLHKLTKASAHIGGKGGNASLVDKRTEAIRIGLECLEFIGNNESFDYSQDVLISVQEELQHMLRSVDNHLMKARAGSAQKTLNERRHLALTLAIACLDERI